VLGPDGELLAVYGKVGDAARPEVVLPPAGSDDRADDGAAD
jgi:hypothetical protein